MNIFGKIFGAFFGYLLLNIPGLILGLIIGNMFDKGLAISAAFSPEKVKESQSVFFETTFLVMGYIAKADGRISEKEIQLARQIMARLQCNDAQRQKAIELFNRGKSELDIDSQLDLFVKKCGFQVQLVRLFLEIQIQVAFTDEENLQPKREVLHKIAARFGIPQNVFEQLEAQFFAGRSFNQHQQSPEHALKDAYGILGVSKEATQPEVKRAYKKLMSEHHPDKLVAKGLPEEMVKMATEKTQEIQKAYDVICKVKGYK
jgi:DnaJ like chaperone protein